MTSILNALDAAGPPPARVESGPTVSAEMDTHVTIAFAIEKGELARYRGFLETLLSMTPERR